MVTEISSGINPIYNLMYKILNYLKSFEKLHCVTFKSPSLPPAYVVRREGNVFSLFVWHSPKTCYVAASMPLAATQDDVLVLEINSITGLVDNSEYISILVLS